MKQHPACNCLTDEPPCSEYDPPRGLRVDDPQVGVCGDCAHGSRCHTEEAIQAGRSMMRRGMTGIVRPGTLEPPKPPDWRIPAAAWLREKRRQRQLAGRISGWSQEIEMILDALADALDRERERKEGARPCQF